MKQQCHISFVYGSWGILLVGLLYFIIRGNILQAVFWVLFVGLFLWLYVRYFPAVSRFMGYGSVADQPPSDVQPSNARVVLYTAAGCPFCPIVRRRLEDLQVKMGFELDERDVTLKPDLVISKGIRALPVVEIGQARWIGNGTSEQLARFVATGATGQ